MAATISTTELLTVTAGDTVKWNRSLQNYPASAGWTLSYSLRSGSFKIDFSAGTDSDTHAVNVAANVTAEWGEGKYTGIGYVSNSGGERYTVWQGTISVRPNLATQDESFDPRSTAKKILDYIESVTMKVAQKQAVSSSVAGVSLTFRSMDELIRARNYWGAIYEREQDLIAGRTRRNILTRFVKP